MVDMLYSLKERNQLVIAAAQAEERERQQVQDEISEMEQHILTTVLLLKASSDPCKEQVSPLSFEWFKVKGMEHDFLSAFLSFTFANRSSWTTCLCRRPR